MKKIVSLTNAIPADIAIVKTLLAESSLVGKTADQILEMIKEHIDGAKDSLISTALTKLGLNEQDLKDAKEYWDEFNQPIGQIKEEQSWDIDWDTSKIMGGSVPISLNVSAMASTAFRVKNKAKALENHQINISEGDVLINHEVKVGGSAGGSTSATVNYIGVEVGAQYSGELEIDAFLQYPADTPTTIIFREYFFNPLMVWDLDDVDAQLSLIDTNIQARGLRKLSINTQGSFKFSGKLSIGKAWSFTGDGRAKDLSAEINVNLGFSKTYEHNGELKLEFEKTKSSIDGKPVLSATVYLMESSKDTNAFNLDVNANIKGLDKIAGKYVNNLLKEGDELVSMLEEWSNPASKIIGKTSSNLDDTKWYQPIAELLLGTTTADDAAKKLIDDELSEILDRYMQSPDFDSEKLANKAVEKLLDIFSAEGLPDLVAPAKKELVSKISVWKKDLNKEITGQVAKYKDTAKIKFLQPIESLGEDVNALATKTDAKISEAIKRALTEYQSLKEKIADALEKSANIKMGLAFEASRYKASLDEQWIKIEFLKTNTAMVNKFYKKLALGDSESASRILATLEDKRLVNVINSAVTLGGSSGSKTSLAVNLGNFQLSNVKNANSELKIKVTNTGDVTITSKVEVDTTSKGAGEVRSASAKLVYGMAQQAMSPNEMGNLSISYSNVDNKLFENKEMKSMLNSLDFSSNERLEKLDFKVPRLIDTTKIHDHLNWYKKTRKWKYADISSLDITVPTDGNMYETLLSLNADRAYRIACRYWYGLFVSRRNKRVINTIMAAYADVQGINPELIVIIQNMEDQTGFDWKDIKAITKKSEQYKKNDMKSLREKNWTRSVNLLQKIFQTANSMRVIIDSIKSIDGVVSATNALSGDVRAQAEFLCNQLYPLNKKIERSLSLWINVEGVIDDWLSQEINQTLLCFYLILAKLTGKDEGFIRTLITVAGKEEQRKIRVVV